MYKGSVQNSDQVILLISSQKDDNTVFLFYLMNHLTNYRVNKKSKKNDVDNNDNMKSSTKYIIISHTLFMDNNDEIAVSLECLLLYDVVE